MRTHLGPSPNAETPCHHCGLSVGRFPIGNDPYFCCTGCETVYNVLRQSGLADTFYRLKEASPTIGKACPSPAEADSLLMAELDTDEFSTEHTILLSGSIRRVRLYLDGVHCAACVWLVERMPFELDGVRSARLNLPRGVVTVEWDASVTMLSSIGRWLARIGYPVQPRVQSSNEAGRAEEKKLLFRVGVCWALAGNVMLIAFALYAGLAASNESGLFQAARYVSLLLSIPAVMIGGGVFFRRAWASLRMAVSSHRVRNLHMDTPISVGILVGFGYSAVSTVSGSGEIWFDSVTVLIAALLSARWVQLRSKRLAGDETDRLLALIPTMARKVESDGSTRLVRAASLGKDVVVDVPAGEVIPVDGTIVGGATHLNNAILTGESLPEHVELGAAVYAGATNLSAPIRVAVSHAGDDTRIGQLLNWISDDASRRAPIVLMADRIGGYFVVTVLLLGMLTFLLWWSTGLTVAVQHAVALLVITCPCALGMATPLALAVGAGRAARQGMFVKQDAVFESITHVDAVVLDKTGTLTDGRMSVAEFAGDPEALVLAARLEGGSSHPIATALTEYVNEMRHDDTLDEVEYVVGQGIKGRVDGQRVRVGSLEWVRNGLRDTDRELEDYEAAIALRGATPVCISVGDRLAAVACISDRIRPEAKMLVETLDAKGLRVYIASGDHVETVRHVAELLGIDPLRVMGRASPDEKLSLLDQLIKEGRTVIMVGDGVNDAAALQRAQVGIAVSGSSAAGKLAADVFMTGRSIESIASLIDGSHNIMKVIRRNLVLSLAYNVLGAGLAMAGVVTPLLAAVAMPLSSFTVVLLSVVQRPFRRPQT